MDPVRNDTGNTANAVYYNVTTKEITYAPPAGGSSNSISSGTSNVTVVSSGGNVTVGIGGTSNVAVFANTGVVVTGLVSASGNVTGGNISTAGLVTATGDVTGGNILTAGLISATGNITAGSGSFFIGNGSQLTGISGGGGGTSISNGTSNVTVVSSGGNVTVGIGGTSNVAVFDNTGVFVTGLVSASGNVTGGNISTAGNVSVTGNVTATSFVGNVSATTVSASGNVTGGNILTGGLISAAGNVTANNIFSASYPIVLDDISNRFDSVTAVFRLTLETANVTTIVDSKNLLVSVGGQTLAPYVQPITWPFFPEYDSWRGFRVRNSPPGSGNVVVGSNVIIYNSPAIGDGCSLTIINNSATVQTRRYPFAPTTIALEVD